MFRIYKKKIYHENEIVRAFDMLQILETRPAEIDEFNYLRIKGFVVTNQDEIDYLKTLDKNFFLSDYTCIQKK